MLWSYAASFCFGKREGFTIKTVLLIHNITSQKMLPFYNATTDVELM